MPIGQLMGSASAAFKGAADTEQGISDAAYKERVADSDRASKERTEFGTTAIQQYSANQRMKASEEGANQRQAQEIESQFITLTPTLKKGAASVTGDNSWHDIPDGYKMRADVYSSLLAAGSQMAKLHEPKTFEIEEGDQVYTAEYDPKTRKLRKLTSGGDKFSPDQKNGGKGGSQLNPFTLQNIVRGDEKTLLAQLGGKGKKGIPQAGGMDKFLSAISGGRIAELSQEEQTKLATLKSLAQRMKNNYTNLANLETQRGLQPTQIDPEVMNTVDALLKEPVKKAHGTTVRIRSKAGKEFDIPEANLAEAIKRGATRITGR